MIKKKHHFMLVIAVIVLAAGGVLTQAILHNLPEPEDDSSEEIDIVEPSHISYVAPENFLLQNIEPSEVPQIKIEEPKHTLPPEPILPEEIEETSQYTVELTSDEEIMLLKLAFAEAGNQDVDGKALVMLTVLNRVNSEKFPDSIYDVVYAKNQFSVMWNGMYKNAPSNDPGCLEALELVKTGYDISEGALYFESMKSTDSWHYRNLNFLFEHGDHWFYN